MSDAILTEALRLAELGLAVHWLRPPTGGEEDGRGKAPVRKGWQGLPAQRPAALLAQYRRGFNLGLHCGRVQGARFHLIAVDCDSVEAIKLCVRILPLTPVRTRSRQGFHLFYRYPAGVVRLGNRVRINGVKVDLRGDGGNLVLPPSVHPSGFVYQRRGDWTAAGFESLPVFDPAWFPQPAPTPAPSCRIATTPTISQARAALAKMRASVAGQGGDSCLFVAALTLAVRYRLDEGAVADLLLSDFNPRCEPPWPETRVRYKAAQAMRSRAAQAAREAR